jgi:hypothetical protein
MEKAQSILQNSHTNIYLPAGIQKLILASMFSEYRLFLKTINGEIIIKGVCITGDFFNGIQPKHINK